MDVPIRNGLVLSDIMTFVKRIHGNSADLCSIEFQKPLFCHAYINGRQMIQKEHEHVKNENHDLSIVLIAENIRTPENVGMIMRLAEAFGVQKLYFTGENAINLTTKVKRASRNTYKTVKSEFGVEGSQTIVQLTKSGYHTIALEITNRSEPLQKLRKVNFKKLALVIGSERHGISEELLQLCQNHYHISMFGENSSINVVNALAIGLYKVTERT